MIKLLISVTFIFYTSFSLACSLHYDSPWFWKKNDLIKNSQWIIVGKVKDSIVEKEKRYFKLQTIEVLKNTSKVSEFKIGPFSLNQASGSEVEKDIDCQLLVSLDLRKEYVFFSESYNSSSVLSYSKREKMNIINLLQKIKKK